jgi:hypothetical protein
MTPPDDFHCFRTDPAVRWQAIAVILESSPKAWDWAFANIERWLAAGRLHPAPLEEWRSLLSSARVSSSAREAFLAGLQRPPADAWQDQLRSCAPFVGGPFAEPVVPGMAASV